MTEDEAREKWCPFMRKVGENFYPDGTPATSCIASDCMMWRWVAEPRKKCTFSASDDGAAGDGYCGAAGRP